MAVGTTLSTYKWSSGRIENMRNDAHHVHSEGEAHVGEDGVLAGLQELDAAQEAHALARPGL
jgi:hypothetical protein